MPTCANGVIRRQKETGTAKYYRRGGKSKGDLATYSTLFKLLGTSKNLPHQISCMEELHKQCESMGVRWLLSYHTCLVSLTTW